MRDVLSRWGSGHPGGLRSNFCAVSLQPGFESRSGRNILRVAELKNFIIVITPDAGGAGFIGVDVGFIRE